MPMTIGASPQQFERLLREVQALRAEQATQFAALRMDLERMRSVPANADQSSRIEVVHAALGTVEFVAPALLSAALANTVTGARLCRYFGGCSLKAVGTRLGRLTNRLTPDGLLLKATGKVGDLTLWRVFETRKPATR